MLGFALNSEATIFKMVENAYKVTLVAAFFPLLLGLYWKRATTQGALCGIVAGFSTWILLEFLGGGYLEAWPPQLAGFLAAGAAMTAGSLLPQLGGRSALPTRPAPPLNAHAAGLTHHEAAAPHPHGHDAPGQHGS